MSELTIPLPAREAESASVAGSALHASARPLIALATQLRDAVIDSPAAMKQALVAAVARFERDAAGAGCDERSIAAASYLLCVWVDEVVGSTPWGAGGAGLLQRFHGESDGSRKVMRLLSRLVEQPGRHQALLELFHACLSLGLQGGLRELPDSARQLEALRQRVHLVLPQPDVALAPTWRSAVVASTGPRRRYVLAALLALGLAALGVYSASHLLLAERVDRVFASMQQLALASRVAEPPKRVSSATALAIPSRLLPALANDIEAGRLILRDEAHRSVVTLAADRLFAPGSTQIAAEQLPLLGRVAAALASKGGKVLVVGHTDGSDARTARLPSAWHQSHEWASRVADRLRQSLDAERVAAEGSGVLDAPSDRELPRRRVEIVLYP